MEVEIKLTLTPSDAEKLKSILSTNLLSIDEQTNTFLDTLDNQLEHQKTAFRFRQSRSRASSTSTPSIQWHVAIKSKPVLENGINRVSETESPIDAGLAETILKDTSVLQSSQAQSHPLLLQMTQVYTGHFRVIGTYQTLRFTYAWEDSLKLELDKTVYASGRKYFELECETTTPDQVKEKLTQFLDSHGIHYTNSKMNKFGIMRHEVATPGCT